MSQPANAQQIGTIEAIAIRTAKEGPMQLIQHATVAVDGGIEGDLPTSPRRGITFISAEQWDETMQELNVDLPWHTRRANILVRGLKLTETFDCTLEIGDVRICVEGETNPCELMDRLQSGLMDALKPEVRGGVHGQVLKAGTFAVGDAIKAQPKQTNAAV
ncbi:MAG: MOSC domain-containing protein [Pirellulales bacterium]|nr:MOSC domain-containing protein [Pirellulales bacterium]